MIARQTRIVFRSLKAARIFSANSTVSPLIFSKKGLATIAQNPFPDNKDKDQDKNIPPFANNEQRHKLKYFKNPFIKVFWLTFFTKKVSF